MPRRFGNGVSPFVPLLTATTNSAGVALFYVPAGRLDRYDGALPVVVAPATGTGATAGRFTAQVISEPVPGSLIGDSATPLVAVAVSKSARTTLASTLGSILGVTVEGLTAAPAGITVRLMLAGV